MIYGYIMICVYIYIFIYECVSDNGAYSPNVHCDRDIDH